MAERRRRSVMAEIAAAEAAASALLSSTAQYLRNGSGVWSDADETMAYVGSGGRRRRRMLGNIATYSLSRSNSRGDMDMRESSPRNGLRASTVVRGLVLLCVCVGLALVGFVNSSPEAGRMTDSSAFVTLASPDELSRLNFPLSLIGEKTAPVQGAAGKKRGTLAGEGSLRGMLQADAGKTGLARRHDKAASGKIETSAHPQRNATQEPLHEDLDDVNQGGPDSVPPFGKGDSYRPSRTS